MTCEGTTRAGIGRPRPVACAACESLSQPFTPLPLTLHERSIYLTSIQALPAGGASASGTRSGWATSHASSCASSSSGVTSCPSGALPTKRALATWKQCEKLGPLLSRGPAEHPLSPNLLSPHHTVSWLRLADPAAPGVLWRWSSLFSSEQLCSGGRALGGRTARYDAHPTMFPRSYIGAPCGTRWAPSASSASASPTGAGSSVYEPANL